MYITEADLVAEGIDPSAATVKPRLAGLMRHAQQQIDAVMGHWFEPRLYPESRPLRLNGSGSNILYLPAFPLEITAILIDGIGLDLGGVVIFDETFADKLNPRIARVSGFRFGSYQTEQPEWPKGTLNIGIEGTFGCCEWDETADDGQGAWVPPEAIRLMAVKLVKRELLPIGSKLGDVSRRSGMVKSETTDSHSYTLFDSAAGGMELTGDPEIDKAIPLYRRRTPPRVIG